MRGVMGKPYNVNSKSRLETPQKSSNFFNRGFFSAPKDKTLMRGPIKDSIVSYHFNNKAFSTIFNDEEKGLATGAKESFSIFRQTKQNHHSAWNNAGFTDEEKLSSARSKPKIVITDEDGDVKYDETSSIAKHGKVRYYDNQ